MMKFVSFYIISLKRNRTHPTFYVMELVDNKYIDKLYVYNLLISNNINKYKQKHIKNDLLKRKNIFIKINYMRLRVIKHVQIIIYYFILLYRYYILNIELHIKDMKNIMFHN